MSQLDECQKRQFLDTAALALGRRGVGEVTQFVRVSKTTVYNSINKIKRRYFPEPGRIRRGDEEGSVFGTVILNGSRLSTSS